MKKPSYLNKIALPLKRKRVGATRNGNEALGDRQTGTDPQGGAEKTGSGPQEGEGMSDRLGPPRPELQQRYTPR